MDRDDQPTRELSTDQPDEHHQEDTMDDQRNDRPTAGGATPVLDEDRRRPPATDTTTGPATHPTTDRTADATPGAPPTDQGRGVRVGTVVWGLVLTAIGVGLLAVASGVVFDVELAMIILVAAAGVALLVGSILTEVRRRGR